MGETVGRIIDTVIDFCRQNSNILMIAGGILILIIIIGAAIISAKKGDKDDNLDFDEKAFLENKESMSPDSEMRKTDEEDKQQTVEKSQHHDNISSPFTDAVLNNKAEDTADTAENEQNIKPDRIAEACCSVNHDENGNSERYIKKADSGESIESLLHEAAGLLKVGIEEVEIKIQGAQVKIKYSKKRTDEQELSESNNECAGGSEYKENTDNIIINDIDEETAAENIDEVTLHMNLEDKSEGMKGDSEPAAGRIKFGPDNLNRSRSGKVFTEKELMETIKD